MVINLPSLKKDPTGGTLDLDGNIWKTNLKFLIFFLEIRGRISFYLVFYIICHMNLHRYLCASSNKKILRIYPPLRR